MFLATKHVFSIKIRVQKEVPMMATHGEEMGVLSPFQNDAEAVSFVAGLFDISEFKLFEMAYVNWYGREAAKKAMDRFFGTYLNTGSVPFWLRAAVRKILCQHRKGDLTASQLGVDRPGLSPVERRFGWMLVGFFSLLVFVIVWISAKYQPAW
jgi:hypothetical protein